MNGFQKFREKNTPKIQKIVYLVFAGITGCLGFLLLFLPFCSCDFYVSKSDFYTVHISPVKGFSLLKSNFSVTENMEYMNLALLLLWMAYAAYLCIQIYCMATRFGGEVAYMKKKAKTLCIVNTSVISGYVLGARVFDIINRAAGGDSKPGNTVWIFAVTLIAMVAFALYIGFLKEGQPVREKEERAVLLPKQRLLQKRKWELFGFASLMAILAMLAFLTKIVDVEYVGKSSVYEDVNFSMRGIDLLKNYAKMEKEGQILAYVVLLAITFVGTFYYLSIVALCSKSDSFFRFAMGSVIASGVGCFLVGMYGKYYEMLQAVNVEALASWIEYKVQDVAGVTVDLTDVKEEFIKSFQVGSNSFYFFLGAMIVVGGLLARRPYSKGLALAKELEPNPPQLLAKIQNAKIAVEGGKSDAQQIPAPAVCDGNATLYANPCPAFSELDMRAKQEREASARIAEQASFEAPTLPKLVQFIVQYARDSRLHLFYTAEDIATFIAGLGTTKLTILQGMSGTGKTSLPKIFAEALSSKCEIVEVESSWRDKNELLGYYNEFSKTYTPKKFTQALYKAALNPDTLTFIVLDEMNLSRIEYYFSDFLSLMENEADKREIKLLNVALYQTQEGEEIPYQGLTDGHTLKIPPNVWFIGTANRDESTFEISDKVYDRAHTMNFNKRAAKVRCYNEPLAPQFLSASALNTLLEEGLNAVRFDVENDPVVQAVEKLVAPYNISFGNRIAMQIERFVALYCACFTPTEEVIRDAVERILLTKVVAKLELKSVDDKEELAAAFEELGLTRCSAFISKLNED